MVERSYVIENLDWGYRKHAEACKAGWELVEVPMRCPVVLTPLSCIGRLLPGVVSRVPCPAQKMRYLSYNADAQGAFVHLKENLGIQAKDWCSSIWCWNKTRTPSAPGKREPRIFAQYQHQVWGLGVEKSPQPDPPKSRLKPL